ncbi:MAG: hypothetical protein LIR50_19235 [Bacillota bacterium]|nr:hypothetical protein [Bacillota bacterium]
MKCINYDCNGNNEGICTNMIVVCEKQIKPTHTPNYAEEQLEYAREKKIKELQKENEKLKSELNNLKSNMNLISKAEENKQLKEIIKSLTELL